MSYEGEYQTFLRQKYGAFYNFEQLAETDVHYIEFNFPIHNFKKLEKLSKLEGFLIDRKAILKELEPKKKEAEKSKDELMMGLYFLEEVMAVVRKRSKATQVRSIKGLVKLRKEDSAKES